MYAQCPDCLTVFALDAQTLAEALGLVICGNCAATFDALESLADHLPPEPFRQLPAHVAQHAAPQLDHAVYRPPAEPVEAVVPAPEAPAVAPDFVVRRGGARAPKERRWPWVLVCLLLTAALGLQLAWAKRDLLIADPHTGPWLREACERIDCRLPAVRDVGELHLVARDVQAHPSVPGALLISATIRNDAGFVQPWPVVTLTLSDADGKRVAMRRLRPEEYLGDDALLQRGLAPGANAALLFEVADPGRRAVAFEFTFE